MLGPGGYCYELTKKSRHGREIIVRLLQSTVSCTLLSHDVGLFFFFLCHSF